MVVFQKRYKNETPNQIVSKRWFYSLYKPKQTCGSICVIENESMLILELLWMRVVYRIRNGLKTSENGTILKFYIRRLTSNNEGFVGTSRRNNLCN